MKLRTVVLTVALLAVACGEDVPFPAAPPHDFDGHVRERAGKGAVDCGVSRDSVSGHAVTACASRAVHARQPFFCRYDPRPVIPNPRFGSPSGIGGVLPRGARANAPTAYIGTRDGVVFALKPLADGGVATWQELAPADRNGKPKRLHGPMTPPWIVRGGSIRTGSQISGIVIVEAIINDSGTVSDAHVLKRLPEGLDIQALELVKQASFEPARFFGVPHAVYYNVTVKVERGVITLP